jgi:hypothetical protein
VVGEVTHVLTVEPKHRVLVISQDAFGTLSFLLV